jgi:hypothetical protein
LLGSLFVVIGMISSRWMWNNDYSWWFMLLLMILS